MKRTSVILIICFLLAPLWAFGQCRGYVTEESPPPAVLDMATTDEGFTIRYWSWGEFLDRRNGQSIPRLLDVPEGILMMDLDWEQAEVCHVSGLIDRTALLFESLGPDGFGRYAVINVGRTIGGVGADIDNVQFHLGGVSSRAATTPSPLIDQMIIDDDSITLDLSWQGNAETEALSDLLSGTGEPLPSLRGWALYIINGEQPTARPWDWTFAPDLEADAVNGYSTDTSAHIVLPRSLWNDVSICFALAPTFDGNGDAGGEDPQSHSIHATYLGHPSSWIALPAESTAGFLDIRFIGAEPTAPGSMEISFLTRNEPRGATFRIVLRNGDGRERQLDTFPGGLALYRRTVQIAPWAQSRGWHLVLEVRDNWGHVVMSRTIPLLRLRN